MDKNSTVEYKRYFWLKFCKNRPIVTERFVSITLYLLGENCAEKLTVITIEIQKDRSLWILSYWHCIIEKKRLKSQSLNSDASTFVLITASLSKTRTYCSLCRDSFFFGDRPIQREMHILFSLWGLIWFCYFVCLTEVIPTGKLIILVY